MLTAEKIAHDIAVSLLPHTLATDETFHYYIPENALGQNLNIDPIIDEYHILYEAALKRLQSDGIS